MAHKASEERVLTVTIANREVAEEIIARILSIPSVVGGLSPNNSVNYLNTLKPTKEESDKIRRYLVVALASEEHGNAIADQLDAIVDILEKYSNNAPSVTNKPLDFLEAKKPLKKLSDETLRVLKIACASDKISQSVADKIFHNQSYVDVGAYITGIEVEGVKDVPVQLFGLTNNEAGKHRAYGVIFDVPENAHDANLIFRFYHLAAGISNQYIDFYISPVEYDPVFGDERPVKDVWSYIGWKENFGSISASPKLGVMSPMNNFQTEDQQWDFSKIGGGQYGSDYYGYGTGTRDVRGKRACLFFDTWANADSNPPGEFNGTQVGMEIMDFTSTDNPLNLKYYVADWDTTAYTEIDPPLLITDQYAPKLQIYINTKDFDKK
jgi:hypothetical protein